MSDAPEELFDVRAFAAADEARTRALLEGVARAVGGRELMVVPSAPRAGRGGGLRLLHRRSGLRLCVVPGGTVDVGLSEAEAAVLEDAPFLDAHGDDPEARALVAALAEEARPRRVTLAPFLLAEDVVAERDGLARLFDQDALPAALPAPLRLPSDAEWEHACRAGSAGPFAWGAGADPAEKTWTHPLGLARLFEAEELTADGFVRGGVARLARAGVTTWPWRLAAWRRPWQPSAPWSAAALRPALSLPFAAPPPTPAPPRVPLTFEPSRALTSALAGLTEQDRERRAAALDAVWSLAGGPGTWSGQGVAALPRVLERALDRATPDRAHLFVLAADLVAGDHAAVAATGLDRSRPEIARPTADIRAQAMRRTLCARLEDVIAVACDLTSDAPTRAAAALLATLLPEAARHQARLAAALATDPDAGVRATLVLGLTLLAGCNTRALALDPSPLVAGAAALARCGADAEPDLTRIVGFIRADGAVPWAHGERVGLAARWLLARRADGAWWLDRLVDALQIKGCR